jgi:hypothetical protein
LTSSVLLVLRALAAPLGVSGAGAGFFFMAAVSDWGFGEGIYRRG